MEINSISLCMSKEDEIETRMIFGEEVIINFGNHASVLMKPSQAEALMSKLSLLLTDKTTFTNADIKNFLKNIKFSSEIFIKNDTDKLLDLVVSSGENRRIMAGEQAKLIASDGEITIIKGGL